MKVTLNDASQVQGKELYVKGLGTLINGKAVDFPASQVEAFESLKGMKIEKAFADNPHIRIGAEKGGDD